MTVRARKPKAATLKDAFEIEFARREMERRKAEDELRRQQEADLQGSEALFLAIGADTAFLEARGLTADRRRYQVSLDHKDFRIAAYFEGGRPSVTFSDRRSVTPGLTLRKTEAAESVEDALRLMAQFLADEIR